jgi:peptide/nickel transport system substrate-binding protein
MDKQRAVRQRHISRATAVGVAVALLASACGGEAASPEEDPADAAGDASCTDTSINVGTNGDAQNINPILAIDLDGRWRTDLMFDPLVLVDPESMEPVPNLAESWDLSEDGLTYTFHLREDARFHDGEPLTADDVAFTVMSILSPDYTGAYQSDWLRLQGAQEVVDGSATELAGLQVIDDYTVEMSLIEPFAGFLTVMARQLKPVPEHLLADAGPLTDASAFSLEPVGSGPYVFESWTKGSQFTAVANEDHWDGVPCMKHITQTVIPDMNTLTSALQSGEIDSSIVPPPSAIEVLKSDENLEVHDLPPLTAEGIYFNLRQEPWASSPELRQALAHGVDFSTFTQQFLGVEDPTPASFFSTASWAYDETVQLPEYDPELASQLLADAGYPGGERLSIELFTNAGNAFREQEQTYVQAQLGELGIEVELPQAEWGEFISAVRAGDFDAAALNGGDNAGIPDPSAVSPTYVTGGTNNHSGYSNPEVDALFAEAGAINDMDERKAIYSEIQGILAQDLPFMPTFWRPNNLVIKKSIKNVDPSVIGAYWNIKDWSNK